MSTEKLAEDIENTFPIVDMPRGSDISFHKDGCFECSWLAEKLERYRGKEFTGDAIRLIHQELTCLSAKAWRWILPHYLKFCLTSEAAYNTMETEFLIYNLGPDLKYQKDTLQRLTELNTAQIACLIHFLDWCSNHEYWSEYCPEEIKKAINFLCTINA